ncbi:MAG: hypothetical protein WCD80_12965 [Desulfobaccales bacterium]
MKLLSVILARAYWFCHIIDINPKGINLYPIITPLLVSSYKFKNYPTSIIDETKEVKFENGEFINDKNVPISVNLSIFSDGLVVDTRSSTNDSDAFLIDILTRLSEEFNLPHYSEVIKRKAYISQLHVYTDKALHLINPKLQKINSYLSENIIGFDNVTFEVGGIHFWPDQTKAIKPISFIFERVLNTPFSENRYYTAAPLQTNQHLELIDKLENILLK